MTDAMFDHLGRPVVVVTGTGVLTALGAGKDDNWQALTEGRSGVRHVRRFATDNLRTTIAAEVDFIDVGEYAAPAMSREMATRVADEAIAESGIGATGNFPGPLVVAVPPFEIEWPLRLRLFQASCQDVPAQDFMDVLLRSARNGEWREQVEAAQRESVAEQLADHFGTRGQPVSLSTACASGASAILYGTEAIRRGETDAVLCVGTDATVNSESLVRFSLLSALSTHNDPPERAARPFSRDRDGFVIGEGAAALVLESLSSARARGARVLAVVKGCGEQADCFHRTRSTPDGSAIIGTLQRAIADAGIEPDRIDYVNPHGTGTPENDKMEYLSLNAVFGDSLAAIPVSSNKSMIGHTLSAAGAIEAVFSVLTLQSATLPPTINHTPDPEIPLDVVPHQKRAKQVSTVLSNSFGFGGQNVSLVLSAEPS